MSRELFNNIKIHQKVNSLLESSKSRQNNLRNQSEKPARSLTV